MFFGFAFAFLDRVSLCNNSGCPGTHRDLPVCLRSAEITSVCHHHPAKDSSFMSIKYCIFLKLCIAYLIPSFRSQFSSICSSLHSRSYFKPVHFSNLEHISTAQCNSHFRGRMISTPSKELTLTQCCSGTCCAICSHFITLPKV